MSERSVPAATDSRPAPASSTGPAAAQARTWLLRIVPNLIGLALLVWFFQDLDSAKFLQAVKALRPGAVAGMSLMVAVEIAAQGLLFYHLCPAGQSVWRQVCLSFAMQAGLVLLPLRSGEVIRPFYLKRWRPQSSYQELVGWTLADKGLQIVSAIPFVLLGLQLFARDPHMSTALRRTAVALGAVLVVLSIGFAFWVYRRSRKNLAERVAGVSLGSWLWATFWALLMWAATWGGYYFAISDVKIGLALMIGVGFGSAIPSLPAGVGVYEAAFLWVGERAQLPHDQVLATAVVSHVLRLLVTLLLGVPVLLLWGWPKTPDHQD